jgi:hypothetical protein
MTRTVTKHFACHVKLQVKKVLCLSPFCADVETHSTFVIKGYSQWSKALERFSIHERSNFHKLAVKALGEAEKGTNIVESLSSGQAKQMLQARTALIRIFSSFGFLCMQGLATRGHTDETSNLTQLLRLRAEDVPELLMWLRRTSYKWISHDIVNEMIELMSHTVLRKVMTVVNKAGFFPIMLDETTDITVREQTSVCFRYVSPDSIDIIEDVVGFYATESTKSDELFKIVKDIVTRFGLSLSKCR